MYCRTDRWKSGKYTVAVDIFACDLCGHAIPECDTRLSYTNEIDICMDCGAIVVDDYIKSCCWMPSLLLLKQLENKHFNKYRKQRKNLSLKVRKEILNKYKFTCQDCGSNKNLSIDHIKPVSKGGKDNINNLTVLCKGCNSKKGVK